MQRSAFLEFRITDKTNALEKALPAMDRTLRELGVKGDRPQPASRPPWSSSWAATRRAGRRRKTHRRPDTERRRAAKTKDSRLRRRHRAGRTRRRYRAACSAG